VSEDIVVPRVTVPVGDGNRATISEIGRLFLRLGCTVFGGPAAHVAVMETEVVTKRAWMTRAEFLDQLGVVQVLPGPNSTELAIHIGHARAGWRGAMVAGLSFVLPSVAMVWALAAFTGVSALRGTVAQVLWWVVPVVVAVLCHALWKFGGQSATRPHAPLLLPVLALVAVLMPSDLLVLLVGAALSMLLSLRLAKSAAALCIAIGVIAALAVTPMWAQQTVVGAPAAPGIAAILLYFLRAGVSVFGSGYVLLAFLQHDLVDGRQWLPASALAQAAAFAQVTPGPLFSTATAAGFFIGGHGGAAAATIGVFAPAFLSIVVSGPIRRLVARSALMRAALDGVVIGSVALLGRALVGFAWPMRSWQWVVAVLALVMIFGSRASAVMLLLFAALLGVASSFFHFIPS
jgi:chromate transporter